MTYNVFGAVVRSQSPSVSGFWPGVSVFLLTETPTPGMWA